MTKAANILNQKVISHCHQLFKPQCGQLLFLSPSVSFIIATPFKPVTMEYNKKVGICIAPTQPFRAALGAESRMCYPGNTANRQTQRGALAVNSKSERKEN
jgi:hypothetical protein